MDQNVSNRSKWIKMDQNGSKWIKMDQMDQNESKWIKWIKKDQFGCTVIRGNFRIEINKRPIIEPACDLYR